MNSKLKHKRVEIKLIDKDKGLFLEISKEGYRVGDVVEATQEVWNGKPKNAYFFGNCVAYVGATCEIYYDETP